MAALAQDFGIPDACISGDADSVGVLGSFFLALLIPGTGAEDVPGELPRVIGLPLNLFVALMFVLLSVVGWWMSTSAHAAPAEARRRPAASAS